MLRKRGEVEQTANADEYCKHEKMRVCRLGRKYIVSSEVSLNQSDVLLCHDLTGRKTGYSRYQLTQSKVGGTDGLC